MLPIDRPAIDFSKQYFVDISDSFLTVFCPKKSTIIDNSYCNVIMFETLALRLLPGQDLKMALDGLIETKNIEAACVVTCVGSLTKAVLRFANQGLATELNGHFEIVSLTGTLSKHGSHCHITLSDEYGRTYGAHLLEGCEIYTTAEIVIGVLPNIRFSRSLDKRTGYPELEITDLPKP